MESISNLLKTSAPIPDPGLSARIIARVQTVAARRTRIRSWTWRTLTIGSVVALVPAVMQLGSQFSQSGFYQYASLLFSDGGSMLGALKDFGYVIAESLPVMSLILVCSILAIFVWAAKNSLAPLPASINP